MKAISSDVRDKVSRGAHVRPAPQIGRGHLSERAATPPPPQGGATGSPAPFLGRGAGSIQSFSGEVFIPGVQPSQSFFFVVALILFSDKKT